MPCTCHGIIIEGVRGDEYRATQICTTCLIRRLNMTPKEEAELDKLMSASHALTKSERIRLRKLLNKRKAQ